MNQLTYQQLSTEYYERERPSAPPAAFAFYLQNAKSVTGPVLEPMCGSGRFLIPLCQAGIEMHGFDPSSHMLNKLQERCFSEGIEAAVWQKSFQEFPMDRSYDLIIIPGGSFPLIANLTEAKACLEKAHKLLNKGGRLLFDIENKQSTKHLNSNWKGNLKTLEDGRVLMRSRLSQAIDSHLATIVEKYELIDGSQLIQTECEIFNVRYYPLELMQSLIKEAGFKEVKHFKPFDREQLPSQEDEVVVFEAMKS